MSRSATLIVGATSGIGLQLARKLIKEGREVIAISRTAGETSAEYGWEGYNADFADPTSELPQITAPLDGLVYCPGTINLRAFSSLKPSHFRDDLEVNLVGAVRALRAYHANLKAAENSAVVLMSSVAAMKGMPLHASVAASKGAIEGLVRALAAEWAPAIRVNAVAPSLSDTPLAARLLRNERLRDAAISRHPMKRIGTPADIADAIAFLLSSQSSWITGQVLGVDGGLGELSGT
jgi:NAD(P)-dependent dehydrogenase (short-subunit alcohol dehydrogenase family)